MVNPKSKLGATSPWRHDGGAVFGRDTPETPWQMDGVGDVDDEDSDGVDEDARVSGAELRKSGDAKDTFKVSHAARALAEESWRNNRALHQQALLASRGELIPPLQQTTAPLINPEAPVCEDDDIGLPHPVEIAMTGYARGDSRHQSRWGVALKKPEWLSYIASHGLDLIPQMWLVHSNETDDSSSRPYSVVVVGREMRSGHSEVAGVQILDANDSAVESLAVEQAKIWFDYVFVSHSYHVTRVKGPGALQTAFEYLAACGLEVSSQVVRVYAARLLDGEFESNNLPWSELIDSVSSTPTLFKMMWDARNHIKMLAEPFPSDFMFTVANDENDRVTGVNLRPVQKDEVVKILSKYAYLFVSATSEGKEFLRTIRGHSAQELGYAWMTAQLGRQLDIVEKVMSVALWKSRFRSDEVPEWKLLCQYLQSGNALERLWEIRDKIQPVGSMPDKLVLVARREVNIFSGFVVLTETEFEKWQTSKSTAVVHLEKDDKGKYQPSSSKGTGANEIIEALEVGNLVGAEGGITLAPDADAMDEEARRFAPQTEKFGNVDEQVCKPEPLITPANVMPAPKLERPADAVKPPKLEGFVATDLEVVKKFQTPPSDKIPVITGPREEPVEEMGAVATIVAMVMGGIAFFYGGAALMRAPVANPAFGSGGVFLSPLSRLENEGT